MSRLGEDYGVVREVNGDLVVDIFGNTYEYRRADAWAKFVKYRTSCCYGDVQSIGVDKHDPMVERFVYRGPR